LTIGHSEIELRAGKLRAFERAGPLFWRRRIALERAQRLVLSSERSLFGICPWVSFTNRYLYIRAVCAGRRDLGMAPGYPFDWLLPLAEDLARRCRAVQDHVLGGAASLPVEFDEPIEVGGQTQFTDRPVPPPKSKIVVQQCGSELTLSIPPAELEIGMRVLWVVQSRILLVLFPFLLPSVFVAAIPQAGWGIFLAFFVPGALLSLATWRADSNGLRQTQTLTVSADGLSFDWSTGFRRRVIHYRREHIACIRAAPAPDWIRSELQIHLTTDHKAILLRAHDEGELEWVATVLRQALGVPSYKPPVQPAGSKIRVERRPEQVTLLVPARGPRIGFLLAGIFFFTMAAGGTVCIAFNAGWLTLMCLPTWLMGLATMRVAFARSHGRVAIAAAGRSLSILKSGLLRTKRWDWGPGEITKVAIGPRYVLIRDDRTLELKIHGLDEKVGLLVGRRESELEWLASVLRQALGLEYDGQAKP